MYGVVPAMGSSKARIQARHDVVAKIAQISWTTHELHRKVLDISTLARLLPHLHSGMTPSENHALLSKWHRANKTATLIGDLLLTRKCSYLAALKSPVALELLCSSLAHFCESEFELCGDRTFSLETYLNRAELGLGSLLGHCLYTCLMFSAHGPEVRLEAFELGSKIGVLLQMRQDLEFFTSREILDSPRWMDLGLLPAMLKLQEQPHLRFKPHPEVFEMTKSDKRIMAAATGIFEAVQSRVVAHLASIRHSNLQPLRILQDILMSLNHFKRPNV